MAGVNIKYRPSEAAVLNGIRHNTSETFVNFRSAIFAFLAPFVLTACGDRGGDSQVAAGGDPVQGGTAVISRVSDFDAFNQFVSTDYDTSQAMRFML